MRFLLIILTIGQNIDYMLLPTQPKQHIVKKITTTRVLPQALQAPPIMPLPQQIEITPQSLQVSVVPQAPPISEIPLVAQAPPISIDNWQQIVKVDWYPSIWVWGHKLDNGNVEWDQNAQSDAWAKLGKPLPVYSPVPAVMYVPPTVPITTWSFTVPSYSYSVMSGCAGGSCR